MNKSYAEYFKDPRWQKKRLEILERDDFYCQLCGDSESTLHVHHMYYENNKKPWEYENESLVTLCENCHKGESENINQCIKNAIKSFRKKFLGYDIEIIGKSIENINLFYPPEVMASIISWIISNDSLMKELGHKYFAYLKEKAEKK